MLTTIVLAAQIVSAAPPLSPANVTGRFVCTDCDGPRVIVLSGRAGDGPFGAFAPFPPARRLDGTP